MDVFLDRKEYKKEKDLVLFMNLNNPAVPDSAG